MADLDASTLSAAMVRAATTHATNIDKRPPHGVFRFNAWWRGGDGLKVVIFMDKATWGDIKSGEGGGAKDFARVALGCTLGEMLKRYGDGQPTRPQAPAVAAPPEEASSGWTPEHITATWERHVDAHAGQAGEQAAREWLRERRGIPTGARMESGLFPADAQLFPADVMVERRQGGQTSVRSWVEDVLRTMGSAYLVPLRAADTNRVAGLVLRLHTPKTIKEDVIKSMSVRGIKVDRGADAPPLGFGWPGAARRADLVILVEGAPDTWAVEALAPDGALVVGVNGVWGLATLREKEPARPGPWATWLAEHRTLPTVLIPQNDAPPACTSQQSCSAAAKHMASKGARVALFPWRGFLAEMEALGADLDGFKDMADVTRAAAAAGIPWAVVQAAFRRALKAGAP